MIPDEKIDDDMRRKLCDEFELIIAVGTVETGTEKLCVEEVDVKVFSSSTCAYLKAMLRADVLSMSVGSV